jgi:8-hydroxy-5-deazaflavin:NADPH oxidoreductase
MRIGILGTGTMGMALGRLFARGGHDVVFGSRSAERARTAAAAVRRAAGSSYEGALVGSDLVALAAVWRDVPSILGTSGVWSGRILLDCTNPEPETGRGLVLGHVTSGAERVAQAAPGARVVKALNHVYAEALDALRANGGGRAPVAFYCGDEETSKAAVAGLLEEAGLRAVDAGPLASARYLEPLAALMVELVRGRGRAPVEVARLVDVGESGARRAG